MNLAMRVVRWFAMMSGTIVSTHARHYKPWKDHSARSFSLEAEIHPPAPTPWYTASLNYTDQQDPHLLAKQFSAEHGVGKERELSTAVENELLKRTGWHNVYDVLGLEATSYHRGEKLLLLPIVESGLGRRLLYMASGVQVAQALGRRLVVAWASGEHCKASYFDLFARAPPGVTVVSASSAVALSLLRPSFGDGVSGGPLPSATVAPVVFSPAEVFGTSEAEPHLPIFRVAGSSVGPAALRAGRSLQAPIVSLDHDSGVQFGVAGTPVGEWRARCHDLLAELKPSTAVAATIERLLRRTVAAGPNAGPNAARASSFPRGIFMGAHPPTSLHNVVGIHARRDQPGVDAPNLMLPAANRHRHIPLPTAGQGQGQQQQQQQEEEEEEGGEWTLAGWSEVPLARYVDVAVAAAAANRKKSNNGMHHNLGEDGNDRVAFAVFSNNPEFASALASELKRRISSHHTITVLSGYGGDNNDDDDEGTPATTSTATTTDTSADAGRPEESASSTSFASRDLEGSIEAAAEWFVLSMCGLVVGAQRSEYARTASLRGSMAGVEVVPRLGTLFAGGALDLLGGDFTSVSSASSPSSSASSLRGASNEGVGKGGGKGGSDDCSNNCSNHRRRRPQEKKPRDGVGVPCAVVDHGPAARVWREWGIYDALCTRDMAHATIRHDEEKEEEEEDEEQQQQQAATGSRNELCERECALDQRQEKGHVEKGMANDDDEDDDDDDAGRVLRRLHVGRTTGADLSTPAGRSEEEVTEESFKVHQAVKASLSAAGAGKWTVVDVVGGPGVDLVVEGMHSLRPSTQTPVSSSSSSLLSSSPSPQQPQSPLLPPLQSASFAHVYASHVLEHGGWQEGGAALREWRRVLVRGGELSVAVPDTVALARLLLAASTATTSGGGSGGDGSGDDDDDDDAIAATVLTVLYGAQRDHTDFHRAGYTEIILRRELHAAGFCGVVRVNGFHRFPDDSTTLELLGTPISLNLEAIACGNISR